MPRGRGNRLIANSGRPRRPMDWECGELDSTLTANSKECKWLIPPSALRDGYTDPTLMASMVWLQMSVTVPGPDSSSVSGFGIIVVSAFSDVDPFGDGCPGPLTDCSADWVCLAFNPVAVNTAAPVTFTASDYHDRMSKAKRRLGNDKGILLVGETLVTSARIHAHVRCLIKE